MGHSWAIQIGPGVTSDLCLRWPGGGGGGGRRAGDGERRVWWRQPREGAVAWWRRRQAVGMKKGVRTPSMRCGRLELQNADSDAAVAGGSMVPSFP
jgi:hypothetical protein